MLSNEFKKSSFCIIGGCIKVRLKKDSSSSSENKVEIEIEYGEKTLIFSLGSWKNFIEGVKNCEFDV